MDVLCGDETLEAVLGLLGTSGLEGEMDVSFVISVSGVAFCVDEGCIGGGEVRMDEKDVEGAVGVGDRT